MSSPADLVLAVRRSCKDWGLGHLKLTETLDANETELDVDDWPSGLKEGHFVEVDLEIVYVKDAGPSLEVRRGEMGTTATTHASGALMVGMPRYTNTQILRALNKGLHLISGQFPREVYLLDDTLLTADDNESFTLPSPPAGEGEYIDILRVEMETTTAGLYRTIVAWEQEGRWPPALKLYGSGPSARALRLLVTQAYPAMAYGDSSVPTGLNDGHEQFLVDYATGTLLEQDELYAADWIKQDVAVASDTRGRMQVIGRNIQAAAEVYLRRQFPSTRSIWLGDARNYRS